MINPDHLSIVARLDDVIVRHTSFAAALDGIQDCIQMSQFYKAPVGCLLTAKGGFGKSTIGEILKATMPSTIETDRKLNCERRIMPMIESLIPKPTTIASVAANILASLGDPNPFAGSIKDQTDRICKLLRSCKTRFIFLDEYNHLFDIETKKTKVNKIVAEWLKTLVNLSGIPICLSGVPGLTHLLTDDPQHGGRFAYNFEMHDLMPNDSDGGDLGAFFDELRSNIETIMHIEFMHGFEMYPFYDQLYLATSGNPRFIKFLIKDALLDLLSSRAKTLSPYNFSEAWKKGSTKNISKTKEDPFLLSSAEVNKYLTGVR